MENKTNMEVEDIAQLEMLIRKSNIKNPILEIDSLIISKSESQEISRFKEAAYNLNEINFQTENDFLKETWKNLFNKQVKSSVARAKDLRKK